jgi:hypothetical protein
VQSVAKSVDTVKPGNKQRPDSRLKRRIADDAQRSGSGRSGERPWPLTLCAIAGMADRCLFGRPGPSISLSSAANLNGLADLDECAFTPNWQKICGAWRWRCTWLARRSRYLLDARENAAQMRRLHLRYVRSSGTWSIETWSIGVRRIPLRLLPLRNPRAPPPAAPNRSAAYESAHTAHRDSDARADCRG